MLFKEGFVFPIKAVEIQTVDEVVVYLHPRVS